MQSVLNEEVNQEHQDYIEHWFHMTTRLKHHAFFNNSPHHHQRSWFFVFWYTLKLIFQTRV
jgi:hypothetical protein